MDQINHPVSGEKGYFITIEMHKLIKAIISDYFGGESE